MRQLQQHRLKALLRDARGRWNHSWFQCGADVWSDLQRFPRAACPLIEMIVVWDDARLRDGELSVEQHLTQHATLPTCQRFLGHIPKHERIDDAGGSIRVHGYSGRSRWRFIARSNESTGAYAQSGNRDDTEPQPNLWPALLWILKVSLSLFIGRTTYSRIPQSPWRLDCQRKSRHSRGIPIEINRKCTIYVHNVKTIKIHAPARIAQETHFSISASAAYGEELRPSRKISTFGCFGRGNTYCVGTR